MSLRSLRLCVRFVLGCGRSPRRVICGRKVWKKCPQITQMDADAGRSPQEVMGAKAAKRCCFAAILRRRGSLRGFAPLRFKPPHRRRREKDSGNAKTQGRKENEDLNREATEETERPVCSPLHPFAPCSNPPLAPDDKIQIANRRPHRHGMQPGSAGMPGPLRQPRRRARSAPSTSVSPSRSALWQADSVCSIPSPLRQSCT